MPPAHRCAAVMFAHEMQTARNDVGFFQRIGNQGQSVGAGIAIIGIEAAECIARDPPQPLVHGIIDAFVALTVQADERAVDVLDNRAGGVCRGAVDDDQLLVGMGLGQKGFNGPANRGLRIIGGHDDRDFHTLSPAYANLRKNKTKTNIVIAFPLNISPLKAKSENIARSAENIKKSLEDLKIM